MKLFEPLNLNNLQLNNRFVMAPMTRSKSPGGVPTKDVHDYYQRRAKGDVGLLITEGIPINHPSAQGYRDVPNLDDQNAKIEWKKIIESVHTEGSKIIPQLWHVGSLKHPEFDKKGSLPTLSPANMNESDIADIICAFTSSAITAKELGFDGIEVHGAHGYLIDQFFSPASNKRSDEYNGDFSARARFAKEVIKSIRRSVGADFPIVFRFSQWKVGNLTAKNVHTPTELEKLLTPVIEAGVDIIHASSKDIFKAEFQGSDLSLAGWSKKLFELPVIGVGGIGLSNDHKKQIKQLERYIQKESVDLLCVGRALISDADFVKKIKTNELDQVISFDETFLSSL